MTDVCANAQVRSRLLRLIAAQSAEILRCMHDVHRYMYIILARTYVSVELRYIHILRRSYVHMCKTIYRYLRLIIRAVEDRYLVQPLRI